MADIDLVADIEPDDIPAVDTGPVEAYSLAEDIGLAGTDLEEDTDLAADTPAAAENCRLQTAVSVLLPAGYSSDRRC